MQLGVPVRVGSAIALSLGMAAAAAAFADTVTNNGQTVSTDVKVVDGKVYVSLSDVAKSLGETVVKSGHTYALTTASGASQIANKYTGKVDHLHRAVSPDRHSRRYGDDLHGEVPAESGDTH